jgi:hypothetical protein
MEDATLIDFALLTSQMHMAWMRTVIGRLKSDYQYSVGIVYNAFPLPIPNEKQLKKLKPLARAILDARSDYPDATLADLYDPDTMPVSLRRAHVAVDKAVDKLYRRKPFTSEHERLQHLFAMYEMMKTPLIS